MLPRDARTRTSRRRHGSLCPRRSSDAHVSDAQGHGQRSAGHRPAATVRRCRVRDASAPRGQRSLRRRQLGVRGDEGHGPRLAVAPAGQPGGVCANGYTRHGGVHAAARQSRLGPRSQGSGDFSQPHCAWVACCVGRLEDAREYFSPPHGRQPREKAVQAVEPPGQTRRPVRFCTGRCEISWPQGRPRGILRALRIRSERGSNATVVTGLYADE